MSDGVIVREKGKFGPLGHAIAEQVGLHYDIREGRYKHFPLARKFADLSFSDIADWMRRHMTPEQIHGFRCMLKYRKDEHRREAAAHKTPDVRVNIYYPKGLSEALMNDFPYEFHPSWVTSDEAMTRNLERILGPFIINGRFKAMQST